MKAWRPDQWGIVVVDLNFGTGPSDAEVIQAAVHGRMGALGIGDMNPGRLPPNDEPTTNRPKRRTQP